MKIDALLQGNKVNIPIAADVLGKLNIGDIVRARIVGISSQELILKLIDGTLFTATLGSDVELKQDEYVTLSLKAKNGNQLVMETVNNNSVQTSDKNILDLLVNLGIKPDMKNAGIARELKTRNVPITKETFQSISDALKGMKDLTTSKAVFLYANKMNFESGNIEALNQMADGRFNLGIQLEEISHMLESISKEGLPESSDERLNIADIKYAFNYMQEEGSKQLTGLPGKLSGDAESLTNTDISILKNNLYKILDDKSIWTGRENESVRTELMNILKASDYYDMEDSDKIRSILGKAFSLLKKTFSPEDTYNSYKNASDTPGSFKTGENSVISSGRDIISIKKGLDKLFIDLKEMNNDKNNFNVKELYKDMVIKLTELHEALRPSELSESSELMNRIENVQNNIRFMNEIYSNSSYIQIPVVLQDRKSTAELYILKKGPKHKKINAGSATMLIALNTENMGTVETIVSIRGKRINLNIRVEDQKVINFLRENYKILYDSLYNKGYKLSDIRYCTVDEKINILNVENVIKRETVGSASVDYRV